MKTTEAMRARERAPAAAGRTVRAAGWLKRLRLPETIADRLASPEQRLRTRWSAVKRMVRGEFPDVPMITVEELASWLADPAVANPVVLDARGGDEYDVSHIEGAHLAPTRRDAFEYLTEVDKGDPIVVYGSIGYRAALLARRLHPYRFVAVYNLDGGIFEWANSGKAVVRDGRRVRRVHPYDTHWGRFLKRELWGFGG